MRQRFPGLGSGLQLAREQLSASYQQNEIVRGLQNGALANQALPVFLGEIPATRAPQESSHFTQRRDSSLAVEGQSNQLQTSSDASGKQEPTITEQQPLSSVKGASNRRSSVEHTWKATTADIGSVHRKGKRLDVHGQYSGFLRADLASEAAAVRMLAVQSRVARNRPDLEYFKVNFSPAMRTMQS
jgi:hypothetical protein